MQSFVSQPLGLICVPMSQVAGDAFNAAARDDTDPMRQTSGQTARQGRSKVFCWGTLHMDSPSCLVSKGPSSTIFRSLTSLPNIVKQNQHCRCSASLGFTCIYSLWTDLPYAPIWRHSLCLFRAGCRRSCMHVCVCVYVHCEQPAIIWNIKRWRWRCPWLGLAGDVSWSSARLWAMVMVVWPTHSLLPCSTPHHHHPCFPTEQMTFMPEMIFPPDCWRGVFSTARTKQL